MKVLSSLFSKIFISIELHEFLPTVFYHIVKIIEAIENSTLSAIPYEKLENLFLNNQDLERVGRLIATEAFILMEERIFSLQFHTAKKRYDDLLKNNPGILQRVSLGNIASYLGITQVTLSRIRSQK